MTYFKLNNIDFSQYVTKLQVGTKHNYKQRTNASGNLMVKYINTKKIIQVGIIPLDETTLKSFVTEINKFTVTISYRDPETGALKTISCIVPENLIEYYTIRADSVSLKAFAVTFTEM